MESTLNDFFNEINEIVPLKKDHTKNEKNEWKECFDSKSGYSYYWNIHTDEVTWEKPKGFVNSAYNGPVPNFEELKDKIKIYKLAPTKSCLKSNGKLPSIETTKNAGKKRSNSDSEDEKITLITSYGSSSSSEDENEEPKEPSDSDDILSTVLKRAEELKRLGNADAKKVTETKPEEASETNKTVSGLSLVPGYDSNSEDEVEDEKSEPPKTSQSSAGAKAQAHSTLFPIMKAPDPNDFKTGEDTLPQESQPENSFDMKNFKRKRRLGVNFVPIQNNVKPPSPNTVTAERKGFGFKENENEAPPTASKSLYSNFTKGGVEFVKSEEVASKEKGTDEKEIKEIYEILHEKLAFLCEGNKDIMPVQIILIQIETLYGALKAESLKAEYLHEWLQGTSEDLVKLEKEAAPEGWTLQWDRLQKRYYYRNKESGQTQWEFPRTESEGQEEAMDICTTPPPPDITGNIIQEGEDSGRIPSPPPAPIISKPEPAFLPEHQIVPVDPASQPLPPGVDYVEPVSQSKSDIDSAFNTFYSELAEIEKTSKPSSPTAVAEQTEVINKVEENAEPVKKKRKKLKLGQGLSLKKKDVSKLVEKWKNAQNNY